MSKQIGEFEVIDHGVENEQYFQGCGVSFTPYTDVATGIGATAYKALDDALDSLAQNNWAVDENSGIAKIHDEWGERIDPLPEEDSYYYVSVRVKE